MTATWLRVVTLAPLLAFGLSMAACTSFEIEGAGDFDKTPAMAGVPGAKNVRETIHSSFWGFDWADTEVSKCDPGYELYRIEYHHNALFVLTSVVTLGLYVPQSVEWWCVPRHETTGGEHDGEGHDGEDDDDDEGPSLRPDGRRD